MSLDFKKKLSVLTNRSSPLQWAPYTHTGSSL